MSHPNYRLVLTKRAQRDIRDIRIYTRQQWGVEQANTYDAAIDRALEMLCSVPRIGRQYLQSRLNILSFPIEHHIIYDRLNGDVVEVIRILHERADASRHL